jgi:hypothetical protein
MTIGAVLEQLLLIWGTSEAEEYRDLLVALPQEAFATVQ